MNVAEKTIAAVEKIKKLYTAGAEKGMAEVADLNDELFTVLNGGDTGGKSFWDEFWDNFQNYGNRRNYNQGFFGAYAWNDANFNPKYDIICSGTYTANSMFQNTNITRIPVVVDVSQCPTELYAIFAGASKLKSIKKLVVSENNIFANGGFNSCSALVDLPIEGTIGQNGFNVQWSTKLSKASIYSVINALSTTTSGLTVTLSKTAVDNAFYDEEPDEVGSQSTEWLNLVETKPNWTISLA